METEDYTNELVEFEWADNGEMLTKRFKPKLIDKGLLIPTTNYTLDYVTKSLKKHIEYLLIPNEILKEIHDRIHMDD